MTVREEIIKTVVTTDDSQLLFELMEFLQKRSNQERNRPARGSYEAIARHCGTLSKEDADEMTAIINREFNNIEGEW